MAVLFPGAPDLSTLLAQHRRRRRRDHRRARATVGRGVLRAGRTAPRGPGVLPPRRVRRPSDRKFDVTRFGIMPNSVAGTEPDQLIALHVAAQSIEDAGGDTVLPADRQRVGVVLGRGGYLTPGLVRLDQRVRTANQVVRTLRELVPELDDDRLEQVRAAFTEQLGPGAAGVGHRPGAQPRRLPGGQPARPARPRVHSGRRVRVVAGRRRPRGARTGRGPVRRDARRRACTTATTSPCGACSASSARSRRASGSGRSTAARTACSSARAPASSCSSGWPTPNATATGSTPWSPGPVWPATAARPACSTPTPAARSAPSARRGRRRGSTRAPRTPSVCWRRTARRPRPVTAPS